MIVWNWKKLPEFPHEEPSTIQVSASAALLSSVVTREQMLRAQLYVFGTLAHDRESVGRDVGRGYGPGRAAPSLIVNAGYVPWPACPGVELPWQRVQIVNTSHRVHLVHLRPEVTSQLLEGIHCSLWRERPLFIYLPADVNRRIRLWFGRISSGSTGYHVRRSRLSWSGIIHEQRWSRMRALSYS